MSHDFCIRKYRDSSCASLVARPGVDLTGCTVEMVLHAAIDSGLLVDLQVREAIRNFLESYEPTDSEQEHIIATQIAPTHGIDGEIIWTDKFEPGPNPEQRTPDNFHQCLVVAARDKLATLQEHRAGTSGRDILGAPIEAKPGKPLSIEFDQTIDQVMDGTLVAECSGELRIDQGVLRIAESLHRTGDLTDTGQDIDFPGAIQIDGSIRSPQTIKAADAIAVGGDIESASIECGSSLTVKGSIEGGGQSTLQIADHVTARSIRQCNGHIDGDMHISEEIAGCVLVAGSDVNAPSAAILGGVLRVTKSLRAGAVGPLDGAPAELQLGDVPLLRAELEAMEEETPALTRKLDDLNKEQAALMALNDPVHAQRERQMELMYKIPEAQQAIEEHQGRMQELADRIDAESMLDAHIQEQLSAGTKIIVRGKAYEITQDLQGPLQICWNDEREVLIQHNDQEPQPIATVATELATASGAPSSPLESAA